MKRGNFVLPPKRSLYILMIFLVLLSSFGTWNAQSTQAQGISASGLNGAIVTLSIDKTAFALTNEVVVHVKFTNSGSSSVSILKWLTPIDGMEGSLFNITRDGKPVAYLGKLVKRLPPTASNYIALAPGQSTAADVILSNEYDFSMSGNYSIKYSVAAAGLFKTGSSDALASNTVELFAEGRANKVHQAASSNALRKSNTFVGCSASQQSDIIDARNAASTYSSEAASYLNGNRLGARYTTWFGIYDASRYATVAAHFNAIQSAMDNADMQFDCTCTDVGVYAYVFPDSPYTIHLCPVFMSVPISGQDSKAGTLIHETSHFFVVAGTNDWAYGQSASQALAISDPASAVQNADSHEYFAENSPVIEPSYTFADVPYDAFAWAQIESIYTAGITSGCSTGPLLYCPASSVTRAQMAVFLLRGIHGSSYAPPAATGTVFTDVPTDGFAAAWIEELAAEGITGGCGNTNYCPDGIVTRDQMAIFLLRAKHTSAYTPPGVAGDTTFIDVPVSYWAAAWIKQLAAESITGGCGGGNYCPGNPVTRAQMAVFLQRTFGLP